MWGVENVSGCSGRVGGRVVGQDDEQVDVTAPRIEVAEGADPCRYTATSVIADFHAGGRSPTRRRIRGYIHWPSLLQTLAGLKSQV